MSDCARSNFRTEGPNCRGGSGSTVERRCRFTRTTSSTQSSRHFGAALYAPPETPFVPSVRAPTGSARSGNLLGAASAPFAETETPSYTVMCFEVREGADLRGEPRARVRCTAAAFPELYRAKARPLSFGPHGPSRAKRRPALRRQTPRPFSARPDSTGATCRWRRLGGRAEPITMPERRRCRCVVSTPQLRYNVDAGGRRAPGGAG